MYQRFISIIYQAVFVTEMDVKYKFFGSYHMFAYLWYHEGWNQDKGGRLCSHVFFTYNQIRKGNKGKVVL
jgi:hypothetical protein